MADQKNSADKAKFARKPRGVKSPVAARAARVEALPVAAPVEAPVAPAPAAEPVTPPFAAPVQAVEAIEAPAAPCPADNIAAVALAAPAPEAPVSVETIVQPTINTVQSGAKSMTETFTNTVNQAQQTAQQTAQQATEQFRASMNDANQRSQAAMERSARMIEEMADLGRGNMEAFVASSKTAAKYMETLTQGAADYSRRSFEEASTAMRSFAEVKSPTDFFRLQSELARKSFDSMVAESARVSETMVKMTGDVAEPITSRYSVAAERMKTVAA